MLLDKRIIQFRKKSFYMKGELVSDVVIFYLQISSQEWVSVTIDDGIMEILPCIDEPKILNIGSIDDDFLYPVNNIIELNDFLGEKLIRVYEYRVKNIENGCVGAFFDFGKKGFSLLEHEYGCIIKNGLCRDFNKEIIMLKI